MTFEADMEASPMSREEEAELLALAVERAPAELAELEAAESEKDMFYALPSAALAAFRTGDLARAEACAKQALLLATSYRDNWNYGNAVHLAHTALGLLALQSNNVAAAVAELNEAGATPGSPQLNSFGPSMELAKPLLRAGEFEAVLRYFAQCRVFWRMGEVWLTLWEEKVRRREVPNFHMNCHR